MYEFIKGDIVTVGQNYLIIENNGIGYKIFTSVNTLTKINKQDKSVLVFTYLHVREDIFILYGFAEKEELALFNMLIGISGIGPKAALSVLSAFIPQAVAIAIAEGNAVELTKAKGIGKKTAQRIILELKDKFKNLTKDSEFEEIYDSLDKTASEETKTALMVLGYTPRESKTAVENCYMENITLEELIRKCLNYLNG